MLSAIFALAGSLGLALLWIFHQFRTNKLEQSNKQLSEVDKSLQSKATGLGNATGYATDQLKQKNEQLAKDPASALNNFFNGVPKS